MQFYGIKVLRDTKVTQQGIKITEMIG